MSLIRTTNPSESPLSMQEVKDFLRVKHNAEDGTIQTLIKVATDIAEKQFGRALMPQEWTARIENWFTHTQPVELPYQPIQSVISVKYIDTDGTEQTLTEGTDYFLSADNAYVYATAEFTAPALHADSAEPVAIVYSAGYSSADFIPASIKHWMKMMIATTWLYREEITPMRTNDGVRVIMQRFLNSNRIIRF